MDEICLGVERGCLRGKSRLESFTTPERALFERHVLHITHKLLPAC